MTKRRTHVYRVATETPEGWRWTCAWCFAQARTLAPTWDACVDALMMDHTPQCPTYQRWYALQAVLERRARRRRKRVHKQAPGQYTLL